MTNKLRRSSALAQSPLFQLPSELDLLPRIHFQRVQQLFDVLRRHLNCNTHASASQGCGHTERARASTDNIVAVIMFFEPRQHVLQTP